MSDDAIASREEEEEEDSVENFGNFEGIEASGLCEVTEWGASLSCVVEVEDREIWGDHDYGDYYHPQYNYCWLDSSPYRERGNHLTI